VKASSWPFIIHIDDTEPHFHCIMASSTSDLGHDCYPINPVVRHNSEPVSPLRLEINGFNVFHSLLSLTVSKHGQA
jgi:hypothetical protein